LGVEVDGRPQYGDVVGELLSLDAEHAVIESRHGVVEVRLADIQIAKIAPPSTADELALEAVAARGWRAAQTGQIGGWLLRADSGFTGRANSVLPLKAPGLPLDEALAQARVWYSERGLPLRLQVPTEGRRLLDAELGERGWPADPDVHVMALRLSASPPRPRHEVSLRAAPDDAWLHRYRDGSAPIEVARALLTRHERVSFASIEVDGALAAIGRGVVDDGWLGVSAVEVAPEVRRAGLATSIVAALFDWAAGHAAKHVYLQVSSDNAAAVAMYRRMGFWQHHDYRYRREP
jgi:GNAT superfamily N-acetyltransferase